MSNIFSQIGRRQGTGRFPLTQAGGLPLTQAQLQEQPAHTPHNVPPQQQPYQSTHATASNYQASLSFNDDEEEHPTTHLHPMTVTSIAVLNHLAPADTLSARATAMEMEAAHTLLDLHNQD